MAVGRIRHCDYTNIQYPEAIEMNEIPKLQDKKISVKSYKRVFNLKNLDKEYIVYFGGVNPCFDLWVNAEYVGYSENSFATYGSKE